MKFKPYMWDFIHKTKLLRNHSYINLATSWVEANAVGHMSAPTTLIYSNNTQTVFV